MNQTSYSPDKFGTYLSHLGSQGCDIDLSSANVCLLIFTPFVVAVDIYVACATLAPEEGGDPL